MRSYSTRPTKTGRYLWVLLLLTLLYLGLMLPAAAAISVTLMSLAGEWLSAIDMIPTALALLASGTYPLVALIAIVAGWVRYGQRRFPQAVAIALLPLINLALFGLAVFLTDLLW